MKHRSISIVIPVYREAGTIIRCLDNVRRLESGGNAEIIVVDGDPHGSTINTIRDRTITTVIAPTGRAVQMNQGASCATGDILLFLHVDTELPGNALALIQSCMHDRSVAAGAFDLGIKTDRAIFRITERYVALRTRMTRVPFGDQAIFMRKAYFDAIGGYKNIPLMEDVEIMQRIRKRGDNICIIPEKVMTSPRRWEQDGILFGTVRNLMIQSLYYLGVSPARLATLYPSPAPKKGER